MMHSGDMQLKDVPIAAFGLGEAIRMDAAGNMICGIVSYLKQDAVTGHPIATLVTLAGFAQRLLKPEAAASDEDVLTTITGNDEDLRFVVDKAERALKSVAVGEHRLKTAGFDPYTLRKCFDCLHLGAPVTLSHNRRIKRGSISEIGVGINQLPLSLRLATNPEELIDLRDIQIQFKDRSRPQSPRLTAKYLKELVR